MEAIMKAEDQGFILEDDLIEAFCSKQDDSLIDYNYLYCQPTRQFHCHQTSNVDVNFRTFFNNLQQQNKHINSNEYVTLIHRM
ncbi:8826_t:CDS:2 [Entrophospora sp. SA101]|nr:8826_t:CDS:2 [Entrophospora sp. SA101]CAJ0829198.1 9116_t:CDS:2 [Entrophospora sp. SA101]CAJ0856706.1 6015_t:CDS:2 [Entrophospora sp. SA101]CAJ0901973.1 20946_t:CDS:2 [Entrophospora sp. SA101]CAJ0902002.1 20951_t:CDS:2 [Entrophospora sp. SA101]